MQIRVYWGHMGIMETKMETTITGYIGFRTLVFGFLAYGLVFKWVCLEVMVKKKNSYK